MDKKYITIPLILLFTGIGIVFQWYAGYLVSLVLFITAKDIFSSAPTAGAMMSPMFVIFIGADIALNLYVPAYSYLVIAGISILGLSVVYDEVRR